MEPSNFINPVVARFVRINPVKWVGSSICLRMALYGCTIKGKAMEIHATYDFHLNSL